ncbi:4-alpha-glucanotransferase [Clostridium sp.]|uniref:4-alpha-glucanotransferase n=1 Tax=Clostridium sp. TaxID=1506 RepID=UPI00261F07A7|nr:4-alpha-glucanotransferase [Clostridium sp.]
MKQFIREEMKNTYSKDKWMKIGSEKRIGVLIPLFSIFSDRSSGIGDLEDLKLMVDWCEKTGNTILQVMPINDYYNSPYSTFSLFALDPIYIALDKLKGVPFHLIEYGMENIKKTFLTGRGYIDYEVKHAKINLLYEVFIKLESINSKEFMHFMEENKYWIDEYSIYTSLKYDYSQERWEDWEPHYRDRNEDALEKFCKENHSRILFFKWVQWQLYEQLKDVKAYADSKKILIMGDLFYVVSRDSADVWSHREYFRLDLVPGLPPEHTCPKGQRWGDQPIYNWETIIKDDYELIKQRIKYNENFYHIIRLDTASAVFRMWCISRYEPAENQGINGFFYPTENDKWEEQGKKLLVTMQDSSSMLICAENLAPLCLHYTHIIRELGIPPISFQRWEKDWDIRHNFILPEEYNYITVIVLSNHDTSNWADWWENEGGTMDVPQVMKLCDKYNLNYEEIKEKLFRKDDSNNKKLRWLDSVNSSEELLNRLGKDREDVEEFIHDYENSFNEKEKLWGIMKLDGPMREKCDKEIIAAAIKTMQRSNAVWSICSIIDYLCLLGIINQDYQNYRLNVPGTEKGRNWTLALPIKLEELLEKNLCDYVKGIMEGTECQTTNKI